MQTKVRKQISAKEYEIFQALFRQSNEKHFALELKRVLKDILPKSAGQDATSMAKQAYRVFKEHLDAISTETDFYESPEAPGFEIAEKIEADRIKREEAFDKKLYGFEKIKERCDRYQKKTKEIRYSIDSVFENRKKYPLYPPKDFLNNDDLKAIEKFLHWDTFLSNDYEHDQIVGNPYLYLNMTSKLGAGGLDVIAQRNNEELIQTLAPVFSHSGLSVRKISIIVWAHQYFISMLYYDERFLHTKNFFIPSLSSLVKDVDKALR